VKELFAGVTLSVLHTSADKKNKIFSCEGYRNEHDKNIFLILLRMQDKLLPSQKIFSRFFF
jgi:hypothetical protein